MSERVHLDLKNLHKLQSKQRTILRRLVAKRAREIKRRMKSNAHKISGALRQSLKEKVRVSAKGAYAVVGVATRFGKEYKGVEKIPNKYALVQEEENRFISGSLESGDVDKLRSEIQSEIESILKG